MTTLTCPKCRLGAILGSTFITTPTGRGPTGLGGSTGAGMASGNFGVRERRDVAHR